MEKLSNKANVNTANETLLINSYVSCLSFAGLNSPDEIIEIN